MNEKLIFIFYHLMRDHMPTGELKSLIVEANRTEGWTFDFSAPELLKLAVRYAEELENGTNK